MGESLFHFRVSEPLDDGAGLGSYEYDADAQIGSWTGSASAAAVSCTYRHQSGRERCNAYGTYCDRWGGWGHYLCDS